jgi:hypothetical protein
MDKYKEGTAAIHANIRKVMKGLKRGLQGWQIQERYQVKYGHRYSESSITRRLREMADVNCDRKTNCYSLEA